MPCEPQAQHIRQIPSGLLSELLFSPTTNTRTTYCSLLLLLFVWRMMPPHKCEGDMADVTPCERKTNCCAVTISRVFPSLQYYSSGAAVAPPAPRLIQQNPNVFVAYPAAGRLRKNKTCSSMLDTWAPTERGSPLADGVNPAETKKLTGMKSSTKGGRPQVDGVIPRQASSGWCDSRANTKKLVTGTKQNPVKTWNRDRRRKAHTARRVR